MIRYLAASICLVFILSFPQISNTLDEGPYDLASKIKSILPFVPVIGSQAVALWEHGEDFYNRAISKDYKPFDLQARLERLHDKVDAFSTDLQKMSSQISADIETGFDTDKLTDKVSKIAEWMTAVNSQYNTYRRFETNPENQAYYAKLQSNYIVTHTEKDLDQIKTLLTETIVTQRNTINLMADSNLAHAMMCNRYQSAQQNLYTFYQQILMVLSRGYTILRFAYLTLDKNNNQTISEEDLWNSFKKRQDDIYAHVSEAIQRSDREMWRCGVNMKEGRDFVKLKPVFQNIVLRSGETNPSLLEMLKEDGLPGGCWNKCPSNSDKRHLRNSNIYELSSLSKTCAGFLRDCDSTNELSTHVCRSKDSSYRIYDWIKMGNGDVYGKHSNCEGRNTSANVYWPASIHSAASAMYTLPAAECQICFCTCDEFMKENKKIFFSKSDVTSDIRNNKVITGVKITVDSPRFNKQAQLIRFDILQGTLVSRGFINASSVRQHRYSNENVTDEFVERNSVHKSINWYDRTICLDILDYKKTDRVLTGIRFERDDYGLQVAIGMTSFIGNTSRLNPDDTVWYNRQTLPGAASRSMLSIKNRNVPNNSGGNHELSKPGQCVKIELSGMKDDAGQNVVPFIDIQPIETNPPAPLAGFGLYLRGAPGTSGYLVPKLITYDYSAHLPVPAVNKTTGWGVYDP